MWFLLACALEPPPVLVEDTGLSDQSSLLGLTEGDWDDPECASLVWHEGDFAPSSSEDWDAFCAAGFNAVDGDLLVDTVSVVEPCLCEVTGHVSALHLDDGLYQANRTGLSELRAAGSVEGVGRGDWLRSLARVETDVSVWFADTEAVQIPLARARELSVHGWEVAVSLPQLAEVETLTLTMTTDVDAPVLREAWTVEVSGHSLGGRTTLPALTEVLSLTHGGGRLHLDALAEARSVVVTGDAEELDAGLLTAVDELAFIETSSYLGGELPALVQVGTLTIAGADYDSRPVRYLPDMPALTTVGELDVTYARASVFEALPALSSTSGRLRMSHADAELGGVPLVDVDQLVLRKAHGGSFPGSLTTVVGNLTLEDNHDLDSLAGLSGLESVGGSLAITGNDQLSDADAEALAERIDVGGSTTIEGNGG